MKKILILFTIVILFSSCLSFPYRDTIMFEDYQFQDTDFALIKHDFSELKSFESHPDYVQPMLNGLFAKYGLSLSDRTTSPNLEIEVSNVKVQRGLDTLYAVSMVIRISDDSGVVSQLTYTQERHNSLDSYYEVYNLLDKQIKDLSKVVFKDLK